MPCNHSFLQVLPPISRLSVFRFDLRCDFFNSTRDRTNSTAGSETSRSTEILQVRGALGDEVWLVRFERMMEVETEAKVGLENVAGTDGEKKVEEDGMVLEKSVSSIREERVEEVGGVGLEKLGGSVGEKRLAESNEVGGKKKARMYWSGEMKRVSEICLVLSTMGKVRGGRSPTDFEKELMEEATGKLVGLCEGLAPKDILPRDAASVVIEELGLSRSKEQRLGYKVPVLSIKEKRELSNKKMEESKKFATAQPRYSSPTQAGFGHKAENHGSSLHVAHRYPPDRPNAAVLAGGASSAAHVSTLAPTSSSNMFPVNEVQSAAISRFPPANSSERGASSLPLPRTEVVHFRLDGRSNMSTYSSQVQANSSANHLPDKAQQQLKSGPVAKLGLVNKVSDHKVVGAPEISTSQSAQITRDHNSRSSGSQAGYASMQSAQQPSQALKPVQISSSYSNHTEIAKNVQKFLHPRISENPNWTPPSTDYMNKSLTCQICREVINDADSLLVCDACENGVHLKCLPTYNQKGIPKGEWHCPRCLMSSNGKPFPPKYGRVTRNASTSKVAPNTGRTQVSTEKKAESSDQKINHQKITANGNPGSVHPATTVRTDNHHTAGSSDLKQSNSGEVHGVISEENKTKMEGSLLSKPKSQSKDVSGVVSLPPHSAPPDRTSNQQIEKSESSPHNPEESISKTEVPPKSESGSSRPDKSSDKGVDNCQNSQACTTGALGKEAEEKCADIPANNNHEVKASDQRETSECKPGNDVRKDDKDVAQTISVGAASVANGARDCLNSSSSGLHTVHWVGDILQVVDEKAYYNSCHINGLVYKLQDHALFRSNNGNLRPSKIQALWEDTKTGSRWAIVNSCYFPADLPEVVGRPCTPEDNEVYESNHGSTVRAGLIQGPCDVLPPTKFKEESERRIQLNGASSGNQPVYLCKWFYDESKGLFRSVTD